jgi:hypothetical protein
MSLPLLQGDTETADFRFEAGDMTNCTNRNSAKFVSAATCLRELACIPVSRSLFFPLFGCLTACGVCAGHRRSDTCNQEGQFSGCSACGVSTGEDGHVGTPFEIRPQ